jgi:hypothetical protein
VNDLSATRRLYELRKLIEAWTSERARIALATPGTTLARSWPTLRQNRFSLRKVALGNALMLASGLAALSLLRA